MPGTFSPKSSFLKIYYILAYVKSLNSELYLIHTNEDFPAFSSVTSGFIRSPDIFRFGGTSSIM